MPVMLAYDARGLPAAMSPGGKGGVIGSGPTRGTARGPPAAYSHSVLPTAPMAQEDPMMSRGAPAASTVERYLPVAVAPTVVGDLRELKALGRSPASLPEISTVPEFGVVTPVRCLCVSELAPSVSLTNALRVAGHVARRGCPYC